MFSRKIKVNAAGSVMAPPTAVDQAEKYRIELRKQIDAQKLKIASRGGSRKRALFIGINYPGTLYELRGCIPDAYNLVEFIVPTYGFYDIKMMTDEPKNAGTSNYPSRQNLINAMKWLVEGAQPGDSLFLSYSGHGGYKQDLNGDEVEGFDETIYPADHLTQGPIVDDDIHQLLVSPLAKGVKLTVLFDSCHSGTVMDLNFMYDYQGNSLVQPVPQNSIFDRLFKNVGKMVAQQSDGKIESTALKRQFPPQNYTDADVICFSSCKDDELCIDQCTSEGCFGVMTNYFLQVLRTNPRISYYQLLNEIRQKLLDNQYTQTPCLSSGRDMDMSLPFNI
ncbi:hypothetical protein MIR68_000895 [Amoeboaphelidium protococcarum]|nr:hypothetical protein MIR68_000895 [Amoeboaphelidium protococcarum]